MEDYPSNLVQGFCWVVAMGALWELAAFIFRVLLTRNQSTESYSALFSLLILLAPLWINAFLYMLLGRMIYFFEPEKKLAGISATKLAALFVALDILAFIVQAAGGVTASTGGSVARIGMNIYMAGIGLQELFILCFSALVIHLYYRMLRREKDGAEKTPHGGSMPWRWLFYTIYAALILISTRIIFRLVEFSQGITDANAIRRHEAYPYCLDALPMFTALVLLNVFHPGRVLCGPFSDFPRLSRAEKKRLRQEKREMKDSRKAESERRAFWRGRDTHPLRVVSGEDVQGGSFESLEEQGATREVSEEDFRGDGLPRSLYESVSSR
ncbi:RTA1 domain-containing protein [Aspergillus sp. HF37]|nr:RTA1 domain-containing protein [Aspergillus sp. HF37]